MRLDVCSKQRIHESVVIVESRFVNVLGGAVGEHPGPGYGETIMGHFKLLQDGNVLVHFVVTVAGDVSSVIVEHTKRSVSKLVPDAQTFPISSPPAFNLEMKNVSFT